MIVVVCLKYLCWVIGGLCCESASPDLPLASFSYSAFLLKFAELFLASASSKFISVTTDLLEQQLPCNAGI